MTRKLLESYIPNKWLIERNQKKIDDEQLTELPAVNGKVKGSQKDFPFIACSFTVQMDEPVEAERRGRRIKQWKGEIEQAEKEVSEVEEFIAGIDDARDREVFRLRYMDGKKAIEVASIVGYTKGRVSQIVKKYVKD